MTRKTFFTLLTGIVVFIAAYVYYVTIERQRSIEEYFDDPLIGDIYKIKMDDDAGSTWVHYLKLTIRNDNSLTFKVSRLKANASSDYLLRDFDENSLVSYSLMELHEIRKGLWDNNLKNHTTLVEIVRKK